uniref:Galectin n=1 Tax=Trichuris muris TaxID=70415 RepID=A0A5S6Q6D7_TRIMR
MANFTEANQKLSVPYLSRLEGSCIQPGQSLHIRGVLQGEKFELNMMTGSKDNDDMPFHMNFRRKEKTCVMNSMSGGQWGKEERKKISLKENEPFDLRIRAHDSKFEVFLNQKELCEYDYRQPLTSISFIRINGDVELNHVSWGGKYYPVPYEAGIPDGFTPGKRLYVSGVPEKKAKRFSVNILTSSGDIALHFNVRFDEKCIVRNSQFGGTWQNEEREGKLNLEKDHAFDLMFVNEVHSFQVFINGNHWCAYAHRTDPNSLKGLRIEGDVELQGVHVKTLPMDLNGTSGGTHCESSPQKKSEFRAILVSDVHEKNLSFVAEGLAENAI